MVVVVSYSFVYLFWKGGCKAGVFFSLGIAIGERFVQELAYLSLGISLCIER